MTNKNVLDQIYMQRCLDLASFASVNAAPNPMVGAVIVYEENIIGEGYHEKNGEAHAEVNAVNSITDKNILSDSTIYVSLEPCAHTGKTPPCVDLILHHRFKRVVVACSDPFSEVAGKSIEKMQNAGIEVSLGTLEKEAKELNKRFFTFHQKNRPYIILKWAQTQDGFMDKIRTNESKTEVNWITSPEMKSLVHKWRSEEMAILVGKNTVLNDNPSLTVREFAGKNPIRILLDSNAEIDEKFTVINDEFETWIFNLKKDFISGPNQWIKLPDLNLETILSELYQRGIISVFVEGGKTTLAQFIALNLWDEARVLKSDVQFGSGLNAPILPSRPSDTTHFLTNSIEIFKNT